MCEMLFSKFVCVKPALLKQFIGKFRVDAQMHSTALSQSPAHLVLPRELSAREHLAQHHPILGRESV
eukprot:5012542-Amphidinium_carterae.1